MDEVSLILGITGTGGVICAIVLYVLSKGLQSKCRFMKTELDLNIHTVTAEEESRENSISKLSRFELEELIVHLIEKAMNNHTRVTSANTMFQNDHRANLIEDRIKEIIYTVNDSPHTRSRSESEESHKSHRSHKSNKSYHSRGKDIPIYIMHEEL